MNEIQFKLLENRLIKDKSQYALCGEPNELKKQKDKEFCIKFFGSDLPDLEKIKAMLDEAICNKNAEELELLLLLMLNFDTANQFDERLAPLLIQDWHISHEDIASILTASKNPNTAKPLFEASTVDFDYLQYQSDYREFNRKCMYALYNIGTDEAFGYLKQLSENENPIIANIAANLLNKPRNTNEGDDGRNAVGTSREKKLFLFQPKRYMFFALLLFACAFALLIQSCLSKNALLSCFSASAVLISLAWLVFLFVWKLEWSVNEKYFKYRSMLCSWRTVYYKDCSGYCIKNNKIVLEMNNGKIIRIPQSSVFSSSFLCALKNHNVQEMSETTMNCQTKCNSK